jgi:hypothetical protein
MYDISINLDDLNNQSKEHLLLVDFLLKEALAKLSTNETYWQKCKNDKLFLYLIRSNDDTWRISLFPIELSANPTAYQYRAVTELSVGDLLLLTSSQQMRHKLLKKLLPKDNHSTVVNYFDFKKEYSKDFN